MNSSPSSTRAFTIAELMAAVIIITILAALGFAGFAELRKRTADAGCLHNLRLIGIATSQYVGEHRGELPYSSYSTSSGVLSAGAFTGTWYYNLAPYLGVPRTEVTDRGNSERTSLGTPIARISQPCVFTCPAHSREESNEQWRPTPRTWPARKPVSYAPSLTLKGSRPGYAYSSDVTIYPIRMTDIPYPSRKVWIMDSPHPYYLNMSASRWKPSDDINFNYPRQAFSRHQGSGNVLFFDGHIERLPLTTFTEPKNGSIDKTVNLYFNPYRDPALDE
ncbi:MAG TPA: prepilin-type N-terminal cleavage/methylation domain-containing protein [Chthoniobacteraceae bacterium]|nr:prepilin-type N-terminal cleavage/methylation domain-containing protein [Chthoniobacteraceae bacterium]